MRGCTLAIVDSCDVSSCSRSGSSLYILRCNLFELCCTRSKSGWVMCQDTGARTAHSSPQAIRWLRNPQADRKQICESWPCIRVPRGDWEGKFYGDVEVTLRTRDLGKEEEDFAWRFSGYSDFNVHRENYRTFHFWVRCATMIGIGKMDRWMILCHWGRCQYCKLICRPHTTENCKLFARHRYRTDSRDVAICSAQKVKDSQGIKDKRLIMNDVWVRVSNMNWL